MAVIIPSTPALSAKLQQIVAQLVERNGQYQGTVYSQIPVTLTCDAEGFSVRDWWISGPSQAAPPQVFIGGTPGVPPVQGVKAQAILTPTTTKSQCDTIAATLIAAIKAVPGPKYVVGA